MSADDYRKRATSAASSLSRAIAALRYESGEARTESFRWLVGYEAEQMLWKVLFDLEGVVDVLNDDAALADLERLAKAVYERLRATRLAAKLDQIEGRTPEEAEAFSRKARELRG